VLTLSLCIWASPHLVRSYNQGLLPSQGSNPSKEPTCTQQYTAVYQVDGLKCEGCALALKQAVSQLKADGQASGQQSWQQQSLDRGYGKPDVTAVRVDFPQKRLEVDYTLAGDCSNGPKQQESSIGMSGQPAEDSVHGRAVGHVCSECLFVEGAVVERAEAQLDVLASLNKEQTLQPARARNPRVVLLQRHQNVV
jgi:copper chaperone CopZ